MAFFCIGSKALSLEMWIPFIKGLCPSNNQCYTEIGTDIWSQQLHVGWRSLGSTSQHKWVQIFPAPHILKVLAIDGILNSWAGWMTCLDFNLKLPLILAIPIYMCCVFDLICCSTFTVNEGEMSSIERSWESCPNLKRVWYELSCFNWIGIREKKLRRPLPKCLAEKPVLR